ncbi:hypothetical protein [Streptomyces laculatispora]|uniref:hypothetical protein n=1 Tax=Streptomyces laculatispora TaxID=887464 RepID=UPI001A945361|nr:hypothetical protein [Streptomyces laculatispora]MBO0914315.1 hypothetical protein [Streptomyces laculatispora]
MTTPLLDFVKPLLPGVFDRIVLPPGIRLLLVHLSTDLPLPAGPSAAPLSGDARATADDSAGGFAQLSIDPLGPPIPFDLRLTGPSAVPSGFQLDLKPADGLLELPAACVPAAVQVDAAGRRTLVAQAGGGRVALTLNGADPLAIRVEGGVDSPAQQGVVVLDAAGQGLGTVGTSPAAFLLGTQGFGLHLPGGLAVDSSATRAPAPVTDGTGGPAPSEAPGWEGVAIRRAELFLPEATPLVGSGPIPVELDLGLPNGLYGRTEAHVPADGSRPAFDVTVVWDDPGATSLASTLPASIEIRTEWNLDQATAPPGLGTIELLGGRPLRVTGRFSRRPGTSDFDFGLVVEAGGDQGLLSVTGHDTAGKVVVTAAALATAFMADADPPTPAQTSYDGFGATLHMLLVAAAGLSAFLDDGTVVLHDVEVDAGLGSAGTKVTLRVDYSVDVQIKTIDLGFMSIGMKPSVPMRLRYRNVRLLVDFAQSGLERFHLSYGEADIDVEDPGGWQIQSPGTLSDLFDVLGSRSGHGSQWFEIDLRFALDLGPVKVSGATVRVTLGPGGALHPEVRGLDAALVLPGLFEARGKASLGAGKLDLALAAHILPLNVAAFADLSYKDCGDGVNELVLALGVDLPGPVPLANSGLGLYGLGGIFGVNAALPSPGPEDDPILFQLGLDPFDAGSYACAPDGSVFGLGVVVGTAPDLGFTFSAKGVVVIGLPDVAVRASLQGRILSPRIQMTDSLGPPGEGASFIGALAVAGDGVTVAMRGHYEVPVLFTLDVPFGARFPNHGRDWYVRLGSDGQPGRGPGLMQAKVLPDFLNINAWAFFMVEGDGIAHLGGIPALSPTGFSLGFGAGFTAVYGIPLIHVDISASVILALGTRPLLLGGVGHLSGSLHLGPVSIGASAEVSFLIAPELGDTWVRFEVCGEVDLFFFSLEGCVTIELGQKGTAVPDPVDWPLESVALADHRYTKLADAVGAPVPPPVDGLPVVWPDVIPLLQFTNGPADGLRPGPFHDRLAWNPTAVGSGVVGNDRLSYTYTLTSVDLTAIDPATGNETPVPGQLEAAWQDIRTGAPGEPGARELALLSWESALWTRKLVDGAVNDPNDPVPAIAHRCRTEFSAQPGWALGSLGNRHGPGEDWNLPTEPGPGPFSSVFDVSVAAQWWGVPIDDATAGFFPYVFPLRLGAPTVFDEPLPVIGRGFAGDFALPHVAGLPLDRDPDESAPGIGEVPVRAVLSFSEPLLDPCLGLRLPDWPPGRADQVRVSLIGPDGTIPFPGTGAEPVPGDAEVRSYAAEGGPYTAIVLEYHAALAPEVLGVRAVSVRAQGNAEAATQADSSAGQAAAAKAHTVTPRPMLSPDTVYRIDIGVEGQGRREGATGPVVPHVESYWFRTADMSGPAPSNGTQYPQGTTSALALQHYEDYVAAPAVLLRTDRFDPAYLERYVLSWMPEDKAGSWFLDDPVGVQLEVSHVPDLAAAYDHDTLVRVRRTDPTRGHPDPFEEQAFPAADIWQAGVSNLQPQADLRLYGATNTAGSCPYPRPGATLGGRPALQPLSDYELSLAFPFLDSAGSGQSGGSAIRGGVFTTSRYTGPHTLLADLGFVPPGAEGGHITGDVRVDRIPVAVGDITADGALEHALAMLALGRPSPTHKGRTTALWTDDGGTWVLHGVLLEAPEPIHRPDSLDLVDFGGRLRVNSLDCGGQPFPGIIRSASGDRLLFLTGSPVVPTGPLTLAVTLQDVPLEAATVPVDTALSCPAPPVPGFAKDLP